MRTNPYYRKALLKVPELFDLIINNFRQHYNHTGNNIASSEGQASIYPRIQTQSKEFETGIVLYYFLIRQ